MSIYEESIPQFQKTLRNLGAWLDKASAHAKAKSFDVDSLLTARLAPDQFPLARQVQIACDVAKNTAARLAAKDPPAHPDTEKTFDELKKRVETVLAYLETVKASDVEGAESRKITISFLPGKAARGGNYLREYALPNFYFHATTTYAILRHNGVDVGKRDYIGSITLEDA